MAYGSTHPVQAHHADTGMHAVTWIVSMLGVLAAAIGAWIMLAPSDGTISVFGGSWAASDLTESWGPWLLVIGGVAAGVGMAVAAVQDWRHEASKWLIAAEAFLGLAGIAALVSGVIALT